MGEKELFEALKKIIPDLKRSEEFSYSDCYSTAKNLGIELKNRSKHYDNLIIEKSKFDKLIQYPRARYICATPVGIYSFDLHKLQINWIEKLLPNASNCTHYGYIMKKIAYINISQGKEISNLIYGEAHKISV